MLTSLTLWLNKMALASLQQTNIFWCNFISQYEVHKYYFVKCKFLRIWKKSAKSNLNLIKLSISCYRHR